MLLKSVITTFRTSIDTLLTTTAAFLSSDSHAHTPFTPDAVPARRRFLTRRQKLVRNMLRWRRYTGELFGIGELVMRVMQECVRPVAEAGGGWDVGGGEAFNKVSNLMSVLDCDSRLLSSNFRQRSYCQKSFEDEWKVRV